MSMKTMAHTEGEGNMILIKIPLVNLSEDIHKCLLFLGRMEQTGTRENGGQLERVLEIDDNFDQRRLYYNLVDTLESLQIEYTAEKI